MPVIYTRTNLMQDMQPVMGIQWQTLTLRVIDTGQLLFKFLSTFRTLILDDSPEDFSALICVAVTDIARRCVIIGEDKDEV